MPRRPDAPTRSRRGTLGRDLIVAEAIGIADGEGLDAVSMRKLAQTLAVDPMSLYHHVRDKNDLLGAMVDVVVAGIEVDLPDGSWDARMRRLILAARTQMLRHPWSARVIEQREEPTPAAMFHMNRVVGIMRDGGLPLPLTHHALHVLGSRVLGFSQDLFDDGPGVRPPPEAQAAMAAAWADTLPHLAELARAGSHEGGLGGCDDDEEFAFSLDLILDGLERQHLDAPTGGRPSAATSRG